MKVDAALKFAALLLLMAAGLPLLAQSPGLRYQQEQPPQAALITLPALLQGLPAAPVPSMMAPAAMPRAYVYEELGIFCKWEVKIEKAARLPIKVRLGEVQYVEQMEGKRKW
jgi:hypothetical protein